MDFIVEENGAPQKIEVFASEGFALAVAVGLDRSFSMAAPTLSAAVSSTRAFVSALSPRDQLMLIGIGSETEVLAPLEVDRAAPLAALNENQSVGHDATFRCGRRRNRRRAGGIGPASADSPIRWRGPLQPDDRSCSR